MTAQEFEIAKYTLEVKTDLQFMKSSIEDYMTTYKDDLAKIPVKKFIVNPQIETLTARLIDEISNEIQALDNAFAKLQGTDITMIS